MHAGTCLTGTAMNWFEPFLRDRIEITEGDQDKETKEIFKDFEGFEKAIKSAFGTVDEARDAAQKIQLLKQRGSASDYAATFRQLASKLE